jgi:Ca-activated chloride channel family protein
VLVGLDESADAAARRLIARTRAPLLTGIELDGSAVLDHAPARPADVLGESPARIAVRLRPEGGTIGVRGRTAEGPWTASAAVAPVAAGAGRGEVVSLYGREAVDDLELRGVTEGAAAVDRAIQRLGLAFQIATRLTSWVAVSEEPTVDPRAPWRREPMPHALPAGLSAEGLGLRPARGRFRTQSLGIAARPVATQRLLAPPPPVSEALIFADTPSRYSPRAPSPPPGRLAARLARRDGLELTLVVTLERDVDWDPAAAEVTWGDGTVMAAAIDADRTTRAGRVAAGRTLRLTLRVLADGPSGAPVSVRITGGRAPLEIDVG